MNIEPLVQPCSTQYYKSLPNDKIFDQSKLKAFADDQINAAAKLKFVSRRIEKVVRKGENAGHQHFLLFHNVLIRFFLRICESPDCVVKVNDPGMRKKPFENMDGKVEYSCDQHFLCFHIFATFSFVLCKLIDFQQV